MHAEILSQLLILFTLGITLSLLTSIYRNGDLFCKKSNVSDFLRALSRATVQRR